MNLNLWFPSTGKNIRQLEFAGEDKVVQRRINGRPTVLSRSYNLYSDVQGRWYCGGACWSWRKTFRLWGTMWKLVNHVLPPKITKSALVVFYKNYLLHADDMIKNKEKRGKMMKLANGIVLDKDTTLEVKEILCSVVKWESQKWRQVGFRWNQGTYLWLKIKGQGRMIQVVFLPACLWKKFGITHGWNLSIPLRTPLLLPPIQGADVDWYVKADDIVLTKGF